MAAIDPTTKRYKTNRAGETLVVFYGTSASNQADTLTTPAVGKNKQQRVLYTTCAYSGSPTQAGVTTAIDSGLGSGYDATVNTGSANLKYTAYAPTRLELGFDDALIVSAPAGGSGQTAAIVVAVLEY